MLHTDSTPQHGLHVLLTPTLDLPHLNLEGSFLTLETPDEQTICTQGLGQIQCT